MEVYMGLLPKIWQYMVILGSEALTHICICTYVWVSSSQAAKPKAPVINHLMTKGLVYVWMLAEKHLYMYMCLFCFTLLDHRTSKMQTSVRHILHQHSRGSVHSRRSPEMGDKKNGHAPSFQSRSMSP